MQIPEKSLDGERNIRKQSESGKDNFPSEGVYVILL